MASINTNYSALVALQNLNATTRDLETTQNRISTGLKVSSARDNGAVFAIAEGQRARLGSLSSIRDGIDRANTAIDTALAAGSSIGDILKTLKEKSVAAQAADLSQEQRDALQADFNALRANIDTIANSATFNGANLVNGTNLTGGGNALKVLTSDGAGGSGSAGAGEFLRGAAADGTVVGALLNEDTDITSATVAGGTGQGLAAGDTIDIEVGTTTYQVGIEAGDTLGDVVEKINTATNGRVTASFDDESGTVVYTSQEEFTITVTEATPGTADAEVVDLFQGAGAGTSISYVSGGGYQANGTALASPLSLEATLADVGAVAANGDNVTFTLLGGDGAAGGGDDRTFAVEISGDDTIQDFLNKVSQVTSGAVTASYNEKTGAITYRSDEDFSVAVTSAAAVQTFLGNTATAELAPNASGGAGASSNSTTLSGFDFRLGKAGQALATVTASLDISSSAGATAASAAIDTALTRLNKDLASLGAQATALDTQKEFLVKLGDEVERGIGNLVDADLAEESARLQSLQTKQQLASQALSIANRAPQIILSLFQ